MISLKQLTVSIFLLLFLSYTTSLRAQESGPWKNIALTGVNAKVISYEKPNIKQKVRSQPGIIGGAGIIGAMVIFGNGSNNLDSCNIDIEFEIIDHNCGINDGSINIQIDNVEDYSFLWSTGAMGSSATNLMPGVYSCIISDFEQGCSQEYFFEVNEMSYITDLTIVSGFCGDPAHVSFFADYPGTGQIVLEINHPNGEDNFLLPDGQIIDLGDLIDLESGDYN
ncbi:MAG: hypothetical protein ACR2PH_12630, partial [Desulfobulbia bacterium]